MVCYFTPSAHNAVGTTGKYNRIKAGSLTKAYRVELRRATSPAPSEINYAIFKAARRRKKTDLVIRGDEFDSLDSPTLLLFSCSSTRRIKNKLCEFDHKRIQMEIRKMNEELKQR